MTNSPPVFVVQHSVDIDATSSEVWAVLSDTGSYGEWNPYVSSLSGDLAPGATLEVTIAQANWPEPLVVTPEVVRADAEHVLHWRGMVGEVGVLDTDHVFEIVPLDTGGVQFIQYEEFRGTMAENMEGQAEEFTRAAFEAMNLALAERVAALRG